MRKVIIRSSLVALALAFAVSSALAQDENPNGFPSGPHYNLNIIGKKVGFTCPAATDPLTGLYGNVVFVPENGEGIQILMQSGSAKGRMAAVTELQAIDPCAASFDGTPATIQLPPKANGYRVYARALAKPGEDTSMKITPSLYSAVDEFGNDLIYLGLVTDTGFIKADDTVYRTKGKSKAIPITELFLWTGEVCYFVAPDGTYTETQRCCLDSDLDGIYDECTTPIGGVCPENYTPIPTYCNAYTGDWVFNIADFVEYLWSLDNNGSKLVQIRFYPN